MSLVSASAWLQLMQLASPALPVGGFSYSEGLEAAVQSGHVPNEARPRAWLQAQPNLALGPPRGPAPGAVTPAPEQSAEGPRGGRFAPCSRGVRPPPPVRWGVKPGPRGPGVSPEMGLVLWSRPH